MKYKYSKLNKQKLTNTLRHQLNKIKFIVKFLKVYDSKLAVVEKLLLPVPMNPGSLGKKYEAPTSGKSPKAVSGIAKTCKYA